MFLKNLSLVTSALPTECECWAASHISICLELNKDKEVSGAHGQRKLGFTESPRVSFVADNSHPQLTVQPVMLENFWC